MDEAKAQALEDHIRLHLGEAAHVYYDMGGGPVHVDVHLIAPSGTQENYLLVTTGMSDRSMAVPDELERSEEHQLAELVIALPPDWFPYFPDDVERPERAWPARLLAELALLPHKHDTWLGIGHTIPSPQGPYHPTTNLRCALLLPPLLTPRAFRQLTLADGRTISFHAVVLLHAEEAQRKLDAGLQALLEVFEQKHITERLDPRRPNLFPPQLDSAVFNELENTETVRLKLSQAQALMHAGRLEEALLAFRAIAELHPSEQGACEARCGDACMGLNRIDEAIHWYEQALVHGHDPVAMQQSLLAARQAQEEDAPTEFAEELDPDDEEGVPTTVEMRQGCIALAGGTAVLVVLGVAILGLTRLFVG